MSHITPPGGVPGGEGFWAASWSPLLLLLPLLLLPSSLLSSSGSPSKVVLERNAPIDDTYTVLVPVAHPDRVNGLIDLAAKLAKENNGAILALRVVVVPEQSPPRLDDALLEGEAAVLELARVRAEQHGVPIHTSVRVGHNISRGILDTATERG